YHGKLTFFAAAEQPEEIGADPSHGWGELAGELELVRVPGDHVTLITQPENVRILARNLEEAIQAALSPLCTKRSG
ncbi:MAG TPA: hypothetical protein VMW27_30475, partial [Thermoanaerobaculia bacterium]|nr:hypothetical protein [Thermoanaerobaculia bacterium]